MSLNLVEIVDIPARSEQIRFWISTISTFFLAPTCSCWFSFPWKRHPTCHIFVSPPGIPFAYFANGTWRWLSSNLTKKWDEMAMLGKDMEWYMLESGMDSGLPLFLGTKPDDGTCFTAQWGASWSSDLLKTTQIHTEQNIIISYYPLQIGFSDISPVYPHLYPQS